MEENKLKKIIEDSGLQPIQAKPLLDNFGNFFVEAHKLVTQGKSINVTSEDQIDEMMEARRIRLQLSKLRIEADKTRVLLKEGYLRGGNAVQNIYNDIRDIIKPEEERLEKQEKYAEIKAMERLEKRNNERILKLFPYVEDITVYNVKDMTDLAFNSLFDTCKTAYEATKKAEEEAEKKRIADEKAKQLENDRIRKENDRLTALREKDRIKMQKLKDEKEEAERKERAKKIADEKRIQDEKFKQDQLKKAPDREKYKKYIDDLFHVPAPVVQDKEISAKILKIVEYLLALNQEQI